MAPPPGDITMNVVVSVGGKFHAFHLARELAKRGALSRLFTSYPRSAAAASGVPPGRVASLLAKEIIARGWEKMPAALRRAWDPAPFLHDLFDRGAARRLPRDADLFVGWSSFSLASLRRAKELGMAAVLDHGSSHIAFQREILEEEAARAGVPVNMPHPRIVEKEIAEYAEADAIAIPSSYARATFVARGVSEKKLIQIPYGVDLARFAPAPKADGVFRVVYAGGMTLQKGVHYLLEAFAGLGVPRAELLLIGEKAPEIEPFFRRYRGSFRWIGRARPAELPAQYAQGSVFVLNSVDDGFGMVMAEAMASGLPVVATTNTGAPDLIRDGIEGFVIPIRDPAALRERLRALAADAALRARMGVAARARVETGWSWEHYGARMVAAYERLLLRRS